MIGTPKKIALLLGNGFSLDFIETIKKNNIDLCNLFKYGDHVPWPTDSAPGFLSLKHCPGLWHLGARTQMTSTEATSLIEDIITVANAYSLKGAAPSTNDSPLKSLYLCAYQELVMYLKHLFVYYNSLVSEDDISVINENWAWRRFFNYVKEKKVPLKIISYNYDVFLERCLTKWGIEHSVWLGTNDSERDSGIVIYKPHGSISFCHETCNPIESFEINYNRDLSSGGIDKFNLGYVNLNCNYAADAIIPPAGDPSRFQYAWFNRIKNEILTVAKSMGEKDEVIICGLSYWHVDRNELDAFLTRIPSSLEIMSINPYPSRAFTAVLSSLFTNFSAYQSSEILKRRA